jgi:hypothetical protein
VPWLVFLAILAANMYAEDIVLPLDDGQIVVSPELVWNKEVANPIPDLEFQIKNKTSSSWVSIRLLFDIGASCNGEHQQWTVESATSLGWSDTYEFVMPHKQSIISLAGKIRNCRTETIKVRLISAESAKHVRIDGITGERVDLAKLRADAEQRTAEEQKRKRDEEQAREAKLTAEREKEEAAERKRLEAVCRMVYRSTIDKKKSDLTVRQEQQIKACDALGMYPP